MKMKQKINEKSHHQVSIISHKEILSFQEAIMYMDVSASFLYKMTSKKAIDFTKPNGGKIYFKKTDLDKWMLRNESKSVDTLENEIINNLNKKTNENNK